MKDNFGKENRSEQYPRKMRRTNVKKRFIFSDTLHRFWKKEHDWGWKKFMELSKLNEGFVVDDVLIIKAQVQVIRYHIY